MHLFPEIGLDESKLPTFRCKYSHHPLLLPIFIFILDKQSAMQKTYVPDPFAAKVKYRLCFFFVVVNHFIRPQLPNQKRSTHAGFLVSHYFLFSPTLTLFYFVLNIFIAKNKYQDEHVRRKFFLDYAQEKGIDPLVSANWYPVSVMRDLCARKV